MDAGLVSLWLTDEAARDQAIDAEWPPASEYLGQVDRWHVYIHLDGNSQNAWPTAKEDIERALSQEPTESASVSPWGDLQDGIRARLSVERQVFDAGEPIPMTLEVENPSDRRRDFFVAAVDPHKSLVSVTDERGQRVPYLGRLYQLVERPRAIPAGQTLEVQSFDLASCYYLRRPGRYTVVFPGPPASPPLELRIEPNPVLAASDGDPIGLLLPLVQENWWLGTGTSQPSLQPGRNWGGNPRPDRAFRLQSPGIQGRFRIDRRLPGR